ncbi:MAG: Rab family GTPase [Promethearchaeota archaeon]
MIVDEINIKLVIVGDGGVGKTSIVNAFLNKPIPEVYIPTIGSNITHNEYTLESVNIRVNLWDSGGQRSFNPINPAFFKNVDAAFLVFDLSKPETLKEIEDVYLKHLQKNSEECITFLVGNKLDLIEDENSLKELAKNIAITEIPLVFISAKKMVNLNEIFELLVLIYLQEMEFKYPDEKIKGLFKKFLNQLDKSEKQLRDLFINAEKVDSLTLPKEVSAPITKKVVTITDEVEPKEEAMKIFQERLKRLDMIKSQIIESFNNNLTTVENLFEKLKNTPINRLVESIDNAIGQIDYFKEDFELKLESLMDIGLDSLIELEDEGESPSEIEVQGK